MKTSLWLLSALTVGVCAWILWTSPERAAALNISDSVEYAVSAFNLATGHGLTITVNGVEHPPRYPFGFPAVASLAYLVDDQSLGNGVIVVWCFAVGCLLLAHRLGCLAVAGNAGIACGVFSVGLLIGLGYFARNAHEIMADVPLLFAALAALSAFISAYRYGSISAFALGGAAIALGMSMRLTSVAYALPFLFVAVREPGDRMKRLAAVIALPAVMIGAIGFYNATVFGSPLFTGYHYWLRPPAYSLSFDAWPANLHAIVSPFSVNPLPGNTILLGVPLCFAGLLLIGAAWWKSNDWERLRPFAIFLFAGALPITALHVFYPFASSRFHLATYAVFLPLAIASLLSLLTGAWRGGVCAVVIVVGLLLVCLEWGDGRGGGANYKLNFMHQSASLMPDDAILVGTYHGAHVDQLVRRGSSRMFIPLSGRTSYAGFEVGRYNEERASIYPFKASESPDELAALLRDGRRVYVELLTPQWTKQTKFIDALKERFDFKPVMKLLGNDALAEIRLRQ